MVQLNYTLSNENYSTKHTHKSCPNIQLLHALTPLIVLYNLSCVTPFGGSHTSFRGCDDTQGLQCSVLKIESIIKKKNMCKPG